MSNIIPPLVSSSPPPMVAGEPDDLDDDEFGDFAVANHSYDGYSLPTTPQHEPHTNFTTVCNINSFVTQTKSNSLTKQNDIEETKNIPETFKNTKDEDQKDENITARSRSSIEDNCEESKNIFCDIKPDVYIQQKYVNNEQNFEDVIQNNLLTNTTQNINKKINEAEDSKEDKNVQRETLKNEDISYGKTDTETNVNTEMESFGDFTFTTFSVEIEDDLKLTEVSCEVNTVETNLDQDAVFRENNSAVPEETNDLTMNENTDLILPKLEIEMEEDIQLNSVKLEEQNGYNLNFNSFESDDSDFGNFENVTEISSNEGNIVKCVDEITIDRLENNEDSLQDFGLTSSSESGKKDEDIFKFNDNLTVNVLEVTSTEVKSESVIDKPQFDVEIEFGNFESSDIANISAVGSEAVHCEKKESVKNASDEDLEISDFQEFDSGKIVGQENLDEFGDFSDYSTQDEKSTLPINAVTDSGNKLQNIEEIIKNSFAHEVSQEKNLDFVDFKDSEVFKQIQDLEKTNALTYHWINSESQKALLKSLNIDSRNILYGPRWNASMPRFAANLGFTPLEPMKSELPTSQPPQPPPPPPIEQNQNDIPAVSFDWTSAGLTNPLDSESQANTMLLDLEQFGTSFDISQTTLIQSTNTSPIDLDSWDYWLKCQQNENKTHAEDVTTNFTLELDTNKHFDINSSVSQPDSIVSNNMCKLPYSDTESVNSLKFIEASADIENEIKVHSDNCSLDKVSIEDNAPAFTDFTSVQLFNNENVQTPHTHSVKLRESYISSQPESDLEYQNINTSAIPKSDSYQSFNQEIFEDDDFTDFQMSLPVSEKPVATLEPLKPVVLDTALTTATSHQINWPEPGVVPEEIEEINFNFVSPVPLPTNKPEPVVAKQEEKKTEEEEDWSDFISAAESLKKTNSQEKQKFPEPLISRTEKTQKSNTSKNVFDNLFQTTSKPAQQLELSVPNLQNTQIKHSTFSPAFIPNNNLPKSNLYTVSNELTSPISSQIPYQIPVHTINTPFGGLPQTSLSVYNNYSGPTELNTQSSRTDSFSQIPFQYTPAKSTRESQFQENSNFQLQSIENTFLQMQHSKQSSNSTIQADDDDWTDFISSQPPSSTSNGLPAAQSQKLKPTAPLTSNYSKSMMTNWSFDLSPNIITNPVHFDVITGYQSSSTLDTNDNCKKSTNLHSQLKSKHSVPSISALPDLDFIAPKNKFFSKK